MTIRNSLVTTGWVGAWVAAWFACGQVPSYQWARRVASTVNPDFELAVGLTMDGAGNLYVTGWFDGTNDFGGITLTNTPGGGQDVFVAKYDAAGVLQWARQAGGNSSERDAGRGIGVDDAGNIYVTGGIFGTANFDGVKVSGSTRGQFFLAKYDPAGRILWVEASNGGSGIYGTGLAVDGAGNCLAVGYVDNGVSCSFGNATLTSPYPTGYSSFLVKYNHGGVVQWARLIGSPARSYTTSVAVDAAGSVFVPGGFSQSMTIVHTNLISVGEKNGYLAKFNEAGDFQWVRQMINGGNGGEPSGVAADASGSVYVTGAFGGVAGDTLCFDSTLCLTNIGGGVAGAGVGDAFLAKYDGGNGTPMWARRAGGTNADAYLGVSTDGQGNVFVGGAMSGTGVPTGFNAVVAKYDPVGNVQWTQSSSGTNGALVFASPQVDAQGNCYLAGWFQTNVLFGSHILTGRGHLDFFLAKVGFSPLTLAIDWADSRPLLRVSGDAGTRVTLEFVPALDPDLWNGWVTNTLTSAAWVVADDDWVGHSSRFYRARRVP